MRKVCRQLCLSIIAILLCLSTPSVYAAGSSNVIGAETKFLSYNNSTYGFQIGYPANWKVVQGFMGSVVAFASPLENANDKFSENLNLIIQDLTPYPGMSLEKYEEITLNQLRNIITDYKLVYKGNSALADRPSRTIVFTGRQGIFQLKFMQVYMINDNRAYVITFGAEETEFTRYEDTAKRMISSFQIQ